MLPSSLFSFAASLTVGLSIVRATALLESPDSQLTVAPDGTTFHHIQPFPQLPERLSKRSLSKLGFNTPIADQYVCFRFHRKSGALLVKTHLSSATSDQVKVQLVGYKKPYEEGLESSSLRSVTGPLIAGTALVLGRINDIRILLQNSPFVYLMIEVLVAPGVEISHTLKHPVPISPIGTTDLDPSEPDSPPIASTHLVNSPESSPSTSRKRPEPVSTDTFSFVTSDPDSPPIASTHVVNSPEDSPPVFSSFSSSTILDYSPVTMPDLDAPARDVPQGGRIDPVGQSKQRTPRVDTSCVNVIFMLLDSIPGFTNLITKVERTDLARFTSMQSYFKILNESDASIDWRAFFDVPQHGSPKQFMSELVECLEVAFKGTEHYPRLRAMFYGTRHKLLGAREPFTSLDVIPAGGTLQKSLQQALHTKETKTILDILPDLLFVNINRVVDNGDSSSKNTARLSFQRTLDISEYASNPDLDCNYILHAVVVHKGTMQRGKHSAYIMQHAKNRWVCFNETVPSPATEYHAMAENFVGNKSACMLVYIKESALAMLTGFVPTLAAPTGSPA